MTRRFPPPWTAEQIPGGYVVKDAAGQALAAAGVANLTYKASPYRQLA